MNFPKENYKQLENKWGKASNDKVNQFKEIDNQENCGNSIP